jgi:cytochrome b561
MIGVSFAGNLFARIAQKISKEQESFPKEMVREERYARFVMQRLFYVIIICLKSKNWCN